MNASLARLGVATLLALGATAPAFAQHFVISHPATPLGAADVRDVYLGEKQFAGGVKLVPVDSLSAQEEFLARVLGVDKARYNAIWTKKAFRDGLVQPPPKSGDSEVIDFVKRTPGAVGYVNSNPSGVNVVQKY